MSSKLTVGKVGGGTIDLTGFSPSLRKGAAFFDHNEPLIQMGRRFANGEASQGTFKLMDPDAELPRTDFEYNLPAHKIVTWTEDASGTEIWLARGRVSVYDGGREGTAYVDNEVGYDATVDDGNIDLRGQAFTVAWERPAETDYERLVALQAYTLNGSSSTATKHRDSTGITVSSTHLCPNTETVQMPAKTYPVGTQPQDVIQDCADTAGKVFGVVIHHTGGSHDCLLYVKEDDHATYSTAAKISDNLADWDPDDPTAPVFEPHWEQGKASLYDGQQLLSGLVSTYGADASVYVEHSSNVTDYDYWVDSYSDALSTTAAQAAERASGILSLRRLTHVTHRVSIVMAATQLHLITAGMSMEVKAAAMMGGQYLDTWQTRRIVECSCEPRSDGKYWVHLQLDRAPKRRGYSGGQIPIVKPPVGTCTDLTGTLAPTAFDGETALTGPWYQGGVDVNPITNGQAHGGTGYYHFHSLANPWAGYTFSGTWNAGTTYTVGFWTRLDAGAVPMVITLGQASGTRATFTADKVTLTINSAEAAWTYHEMEWTPASTISSSGAAGGSDDVIIDFECAAHSSAGMDFDDGSVMSCSPAASPVSIGGPGEGTIGTGTPVVIPIGTVIEHGDQSGKGGTMHDAEQIEVTPFGTIAATNVQDALEEVVAEATSGAPTDADYLVGTANGSLSNEIVVGTTPGGELGGTWASPTVDSVHSGSAHVTALDGLSDVDLTTDPPADEEVLTFESSTSLWVPKPAPGGGSGLTVEEVDGAPSVAATTLVFPNGTLTDNGSGEVEYTPAGAGGATIQFPGLKPATPTYDFDGASLSGDFSAHSTLGSFTTSHVKTQGVDWVGSSVELQFSGQNGQIYVAHGNGDIDFSVGGIMMHGFVDSVRMLGIAALNSSGSGIGVTAYTDGQAYFAAISSWAYASFSNSANLFGIKGTDQDRWWLRVTRTSGTWRAYVSLNGRAWDTDFSSATRSDSVTVDRLVFGILYNPATSYYGTLSADYFHVAT